MEYGNLIIHNQNFEQNFFNDLSNIGVSIVNSIAKQDIVLKNKIITNLKIDKCKFNSSLTFIGCDFFGCVSINDSKILKSLTFIDCKIHEDINIIHSNINNSFELVLTKISEDIRIDGTSANIVKLISVKLDNFIIETTDYISSIRNIILKNSNILNSIILSNISDLISFDVMETRSLNVNITNMDLKNSLYRFQGSSIDKITIQNIQNYDTAQIDFSNISFNQMLLDNILVDFIRRKKIARPFLKKKEHIYNYKTLKVFRKKFIYDNDYYLDDKAYYLMKNEELKSNKIRNYYGFIAYIIHHIFRFVFGWGVEIKNVIASMAIINVLFSVFYYFYFDYREHNSITYLGTSYHNFDAAILTSLLSFLGQYSDIQFLVPINSFFLIIEFIIGGLMWATIIGIIIRKLVR
jgi:hypothetical protein